MRNIIFLLIFILGGYYGYTSSVQRNTIGRITTRASIVQAHEEKLAELASRPEYQPTWQDIVDEIVRVFTPSGKEAVNWALRCFYSESKWNAFAVNDKNRNGTIDRGVAQINSIHNYKEADLYNYKFNIQKAYELWLRRGKGAWYGSQCF